MRTSSAACTLTAELTLHYARRMQPKLTGYAVDPSVRKRAVTQQRRLAALGQVTMFEGLSKRSLARIDQLATVRHAAAGEKLMEQGEKGDHMMVVLEGHATVRRGKRKLGEVTPGQCVGEMALLDNEPRSATVVAEEPMQLLSIPGPAFRKLLPKVPRITDTVLATLSARLREANAAADF